MANLTGTFWRRSGRIAVFLTRPVGVLLGLLTVMLLLLVTMWYFLPIWLPQLADRLLPADVRLELDGRPGWRRGEVTLPGFRLGRQRCVWIDGQDLRGARHGGVWRLVAGQVTVDTTCAATAAGDGAPLTWAALDRAVPPTVLHISQLTVAPWPEYGGSLDVEHLGGATSLRFHQPRLTLSARLRDNQLTLEEFTLRGAAAVEPAQTDARPHINERQFLTPASGAAAVQPALAAAGPHIKVHGTMTLSSEVAAPPDQGALVAELMLPGGAPLGATLDWRSTQGVLQATDPRNGVVLARLPWRIHDDDLIIEEGEWRWPYATQPLSGQVAVTLNHWRAASQALEVSARINMLTQGLRGKANAVLTVGPGPLRLADNALDFHFTGLANVGDLSLDASIPGQLRGLLTDPRVAMLPGALLRVVGPVSRALNINSARLPLAGVQLSSRGLSGRLQAILQADAKDYGRFTLHMDGRAVDFLPDRGQWRWRYWGDGYLAPLSARWDLSGRGSWLADTIELSELSSGFAQLRYGLVDVAAPRVTLLTPLSWRRGPVDPAFSGALRLDARRIDIMRGGFLPRPSLNLRLTGSDPQNFLWRGELRAGEAAPGAATIGPVRLNGRWDGVRLRGQAWWPPQPLRIFQSLLEPSLKITLRDGVFYAQSAFSAAAGQGFLAGGHAAIRQGDIWAGETRLRGVDLAMSYRLQDRRWLLGVKQPIGLKIKAIETPIRLNNLAIGLRGYYPYDLRRPLTLTGVDVDALGGAIHLTPLSLPQRDAAMLQVRSIEMSELITALKPKQFAISGRVSGELPLQLDDPRGYIRRGWIASDGTMALRLDQQFADAIGSRNLATGAGINWLRYMEITRLRADLAVSRSGELAMLAHIVGTNPRVNAQREVRINYRHEENIFQLWRSLRFGANVEQSLEQQAIVPIRPVRGNQ